MTEPDIMEIGRAVAARIKGQLDDFHAESVHLEREEAAMALGLIEALIGILEVELKK
ncbi:MULTISPECIES: hypothetical protein [unclassified Sphingomonas]|uniref:hypothetical protein n=1 Tax=unclassified Sphingomonas TaxID=196159 RepID=UPI00226A6DF7|nr:MULTISPECIES: hypothetical protein [unclassified Sphingomonas]